MTVFLIALFLAHPPVEYPVGAKVAVVIAAFADISIIRGAYLGIIQQLIQIRQALENDDSDED